MLVIAANVVWTFEEKNEATRVPFERISYTPPVVALFTASVVYPVYTPGELVPIPTLPEDARDIFAAAADGC